MAIGLQNLLDYLAHNNLDISQKWKDWHIRPINGGANNLLYHTQNYDYDLAIKFTIRDERKRATREYNALKAIEKAGLNTAPKAILLDTESYTQPVVVQTWIQGQQIANPPKTDADWQELINCICKIHSLTQQPQFNLADAVLSFKNGNHGKVKVLESAARIPKEARPKTMTDLLSWFENWEPPPFPEAQLALCHSDPNWCNFIQDEKQLYAVDWENSGWGDPAFEIADLMTHPAYEIVDEDRWEFVIQTYLAITNDRPAEVRIRTYHIQMLMWWVIRSARYLYEIPLGLDNRLVEPPKGWDQRAKLKIEEYADRMKLAISQL